MQIIQGTTKFRFAEKSAVAIGKFDGIHKGHIALLDHVLKQKEKGLLAAVFTFDPPASVFFGKAGEKELSTKMEKRKVFELLGIDVLIEFPLNRETASIPPAVFIKQILAGQMQAAFIAAGNDLSFGAGGTGDKDLLEASAAELGYQVQLIDKVMDQEKEISSTLVREEVEKGNMETAARLLGRNYSITGIVEEGRKLGRQLGMPTLNLYPPEDKLLPPRGVYYSLITCDGLRYRGITNIGYKPTVNDTPSISVETYLYDYKGDMYGKEIITELIHFKRPEQKFQDVDALKAQMQKDIEEGRMFHENRINNG